MTNNNEKEMMKLLTRAITGIEDTRADIKELKG